MASVTILGISRGSIYNYSGNPPKAFIVGHALHHRHACRESCNEILSTIYMLLQCLDADKYNSMIVEPC